MGAPEKAPATYEDVRDAPAHVVAQVIHGVLHTHPRPGVPHARASTKLGASLDGPFDSGRSGPGGWILLFEPELHLGPSPDIVVPDLDGWRRERMPTVPSDAFITLAPDWVCEVLASSTRKLDRSDKMDVYAREGVGHLCLWSRPTAFSRCFDLPAERGFGWAHGTMTMRSGPNPSTRYPSTWLHCGSEPVGGAVLSGGGCDSKAGRTRLQLPVPRWQHPGRSESRPIGQGFRCAYVAKAKRQRELARRLPSAKGR